ncbi:MAG TPA: deoxyguanosinetriphosphate triphosphohydrolase [Candidatus Desulfofervidus auxilii]|uniref:Deoxyguanosinetriphosphate triphosphohydrolase-like protein n=1 Tax=Desulfofervidus auxilii TaxID=1621989 RepID=A0A7V0I9U1_DESA2|nr:deoxyguanosinetriphosphate triphosphohydrolase [Candidatus Desulfofervidus auxilii]
MQCLREIWEEKEKRILSPYATISANSKGRLRPEPECPLRTAFQRDRDRIIHCKAFRRLKHKTQVFLSPTGDHYRTRLTHTLEVAQIARTIARCLGLNEDLTEAIALGHDLGHTPFGHAGEEVLNEIVPGGFAHNEQSLRIVDILEYNGKGLNLTYEVRDGILKHSKGRGEIIPTSGENKAITLEGQIVRVADIIAYISHDIEDAIRASIIKENDIPLFCQRVLGKTHAKRINTMVLSLVTESLKQNKIAISEEILEAMFSLREFLFERVYFNPQVRRDFKKAKRIIKDLYFKFLEDEKLFIEIAKVDYPLKEKERVICDFIAGMTDRYALNLYKHLFLPRPWMIL